MDAEQGLSSTISVGRSGDRRGSAGPGDIIPPATGLPMLHQTQRHPAALQLHAIHKSYGDVEVLTDIDMSIDVGEFVTILGASGCGKTTLLKIIAGFERANSGKVMLAGSDLTQTSPSRREIGMVFQNYALFPHMTVFQNVAFPLEMRRLSKREIDQRVEEALGLVALEAFLHRYPNELSGGQQQRAALARAIVFEPKLLLLDEPFSALDRRLRETMQLEVKALQRRLGLTTIFITHDQGEALTMSNRIAVMSKGSVLQIGTPSEIYHHPGNTEVAEFIGDSNILEGTLSKEGSRAVFRTKSGLTFRLAQGATVPHDGPNQRLLLRPERIRLGPVEENTAEANTLIGQISDVTFLGASTLYTVNIAPQERLTVRCLAAEADGEYEIGERVFLSIPSTAGRLLPEGAH